MGFLVDQPPSLLANDLGEGQRRVSLLPEPVDDGLLDGVELGALVREAPPGSPVREQAVVHLIGRDDASALEGARNAVDAGGELRPFPMHRRQP